MKECATVVDEDDEVIALEGSPLKVLPSAKYRSLYSCFTYLFPI